MFCVRQHGASPGAAGEAETGLASTHNPMSGAGSLMARPGSAMSMLSSSMSATSSSCDTPATVGVGVGVRIRDKPAKLAIQAPGGRIIRLNRKAEQPVGSSWQGRGAEGGVEEVVQGSLWETIVKVQEKGTWRGLVLADRSARWCVWGEWECV